MKTLGALLLISAFSLSSGAAETNAVFPEEIGEGAAVSATAESEIPLNLEKKVQGAGEGSHLARILGGLCVLGLMAGGAFYLLRRHSKPGQRINAPQIKVLTQHWLGPKKSLAIVRVAGESILIGVTDQNISMLKSLALIDDEVPVETPDQFDRVLDSENKFAATVKAPEDEDFMISGLAQVKESVSKRLKGMRSFQ